MNLEKSIDDPSLRIEILVCLVCVIVIFFISGRVDLLEMLVAVSRDHEKWELDELIVTGGLSCFVLLGFVFRRWVVSRRLRKKLARQYTELKNVHAEIRRLKGIVPICSSCKKIRDDKGFWQQVEQYIEDHSDAVFSHGMCPDCLDKYYGDEPWYENTIGKK